jgi:hypothetical protein
VQQHSVSTNIYSTLAYRSLQDFKKKIFSDEEVFEQIKLASRKAYKKCWKEFKEINPMINFEEGPLERKPSPSSSRILECMPWLA